MGAGGAHVADAGGAWVRPVGLGADFAAAGLVWAPARPGLAMAIAVFKAMTWVLFGYSELEWVLTAIAIGRTG